MVAGNAQPELSIFYTFALVELFINATYSCEFSVLNRLGTIYQFKLTSVTNNGRILELGMRSVRISSELENFFFRSAMIEWYSCSARFRMERLVSS